LVVIILLGAASHQRILPIQSVVTKFFDSQKLIVLAIRSVRESEPVLIYSRDDDVSYGGVFRLTGSMADDRRSHFPWQVRWRPEFQ
jgi:hypothetical protein